MNKPIPQDVPEGLWDRVAPTGFCWEWIGTRRKNGYGVIGIKGQQYMAHRVVYSALVRDPGDLDLDHLCRNVSCVNPDHLDPVRSEVNSLRGFGALALNARKTHCVRGHELPEPGTDGKRVCGVCAADYRRDHARAAYQSDPQAGAERAREYRRRNREAVNARARERRAAKHAK